MNMFYFERWLVLKNWLIAGQSTRALGVSLRDRKEGNDKLKVKQLYVVQQIFNHGVSSNWDCSENSFSIFLL